jgi:arabinosaccharide transport system substrate-binding protein
MSFPYGTAPLAILVIALASGAWLIAPRGSADSFDNRPPDLVYATFVKEHAEAYRPAIAKFEQRYGVRIQLEVVDQKALQDRLESALQVGAQVPDMVELLAGTMGLFTRGPLEGVGFVDLTDQVHKTGLYDRLVTNRFSKWSSRGHIFALPHDVHPVMLAYRRDLVEQLGIDVNKLTTWDEFCRVGREVVAKTTGPDGIPTHYMIDFPTDGSDILQLLILQYGGSLFNAAGQVRFDSDQSLDVMCWYVKQIQGKDRISFPCGQGQSFSMAVIDGLCLFYICPDWRTIGIESDIPSVAGKLSLMPLPARTPGGIRTSTWGGTGLAFTKQCRNFDLAWKLAMYLYYDPDQLGPRFAATHILPPLKAAWNRPEFFQPSAFFSGVELGRAYAQLAPQVPPQYDTAYNTMAISKLSEAFTNTSEYYATHGDNGLRDYARAQLKRSADQLRVIMDRNVFLKASASEMAAAPSP